LLLKVSITPKASKVIDAIADFVESKNTPGSGGRFAVKFIDVIEKLALPNLQYAVCAHPVLAAYKYSCRYFNDWVIAFKIYNDELTVYEIIHSSLLF
jgi:hypothetical protein